MVVVVVVVVVVVTMMSCCERHRMNCLPPLCERSAQEYSELWLSNCHKKAGQEQDVMVLA